MKREVTAEADINGLAGPWNEKSDTKSIAQHSDAGVLIVRCMADVQPQPLSWLWPHRIARRKLSIMAGPPGRGKSQITASLTAVVTTGGKWPVDGSSCPLGRVVILSAEDDPEDTIWPRLKAAGADVSRVHTIEGVIRGYAGDGTRADRMFSIAEDIQALGRVLSELRDVVLVIVDPISAYLGKTDSHKNAEVRAVLAPLAELAAKFNVAILGITHLSKASGPAALMRVMGSVAFVAAARAAWLVTNDPQDNARRLFLPLKNNLGPDQGGLAFRIEAATVQSPKGPIETSRVMWESTPVTLSADEAMQAVDNGREPSALDKAVDWLRETLADRPLASTDVITRAAAVCIAEKTLRRAASKVGIKPAKDGKGGWKWSL